MLRFHTHVYYVHACYHVHRGDCDRTAGVGILFSPYTPPYGPHLYQHHTSSFHSLARFHASYSNCLASFLITLLLQHDSVTDSQVSDHVTDHSTTRLNHHWRDHPQSYERLQNAARENADLSTQDQPVSLDTPFSKNFFPQLCLGP